MKHARPGSRKFFVVVFILSVGGVLCVMALGLAAVHRLTSDAVKVLEAFASMASVAVFAFMGGNAAEHLAKRSKPQLEGGDDGGLPE